MSLNTTSQVKEKYLDGVWIVNSGATSHIVHSDKNLTNFGYIKTTVSTIIINFSLELSEGIFNNTPIF